jgi:hypothetical protein
MGQAKNETRKTTTLISMVRNEKGILETFSGHALSLFDRVILIDHLSSDGTREYIELLSENHEKIEYYCFDEPGYYQSELMTWAARNLVDNEIPGWVFFLDADEFLPFKSKEEFDSALFGLSRFPVISMAWLNLIPLEMENGRVINELFLEPPQHSTYHKIAFQPSCIPSAEYFITQGNHQLFMGNSSWKLKVPTRTAFSIYHLPIRTKQQLREKIVYGVESYRRMGSNRRGNEGFHWEEIHRVMQATTLTNELMAGIAVQYSDTLQPPYERNLDDLRKEGYRELRMDVGFLKPAISFADLAGSRRDKVFLKNPGSQGKGSCDHTVAHRRIAFDPLTLSCRLQNCSARTVWKIV